MKQMKAAQVSKAGGDFGLVQRDVPEPRQGEVRIKVEAWAFVIAWPQRWSLCPSAPLG